MKNPTQLGVMLPAALFASLEANLASASLLAPVVSLDAFAWRLMPPARRAEARAAGLTDHWLSAAWARHAPLRMRPHVAHEARRPLRQRHDASHGYLDSLCGLCAPHRGQNFFHSCRSGCFRRFFVVK